MHRGVARVGNTLTRKSDLVETLDEVISTGSLCAWQVAVFGRSDLVEIS